MNKYSLDIGATPTAEGVFFKVWAPLASTVEVELVDKDSVKMQLMQDGEYFHGLFPVSAGERYWYWIDSTVRRSDPASRSQPDGVHGPSQIIDSAYDWSDSHWSGITLEECIIYELHVGVFTPEGTFDAAIEHLDYLRELGITAIELMPVAQFPGARNWGYDGVFPFAPQHTYGGASGLKRFVDACHSRGLAVFLDVVYNHLGPEGNYLHAFGPYFTDRYLTPWGDAVNFDGPYSDGVRHFFVSNARYWVSEYHLDGLRLDAVHGIFDFSTRHILAELTDTVHQLASKLGRTILVIAESDLNDSRLVNDSRTGGYGLDAQWCDDFHHSLRSQLTDDKNGYYCDYGLFSDLVKSFREGFVLSGGYSSYRKRRHGSSSTEIPPCRLVVFSQNHDQVGNRMRGERLSEHLTVPQLKLAAASVMLSTYVPLIFMGEEYAESAPFPYFISHGDTELIETVKQGRLNEFAAFAHQGFPPDPQAELTFRSAKLNTEQRHQGDHQVINDFYRQLIGLRKEYALLSSFSRDGIQIIDCEDEQVLIINRSSVNFQLNCLFNFSNLKRVIDPSLVNGTITIILDSSGKIPLGSQLTVFTTRPNTFLTLAPFGVVVYLKEK